MPFSKNYLVSKAQRKREIEANLQTFIHVYTILLYSLKKTGQKPIIMLLLRTNEIILLRKWITYTMRTERRIICWAKISALKEWRGYPSCLQLLEPGDFHVCCDPATVGIWSGLGFIKRLYCRNRFQSAVLRLTGKLSFRFEPVFRAHLKMTSDWWVVYRHDKQIPAANLGCTHMVNYQLKRVHFSEANILGWPSCCSLCWQDGSNSHSSNLVHFSQLVSILSI